MGTLFWVGPRVLARVGDWLKEPMNKVDHSGETSFHTEHCHHGLPWVGRSQKQTVWSRVASGNPDQDYVLGGVFLHHGQEEEGGARDQGVAPLHPDKFSQNPRRGSNMEPSDHAIAYPSDHELSSLSSCAGSPVIRE